MIGLGIVIGFILLFAGIAYLIAKKIDKDLHG